MLRIFYETVDGGKKCMLLLEHEGQGLFFMFFFVLSKFNSKGGAISLNKNKRFKHVNAFLALWLVIISLAPLFNPTIIYATESDSTEESKKDDGNSYSLFDRAELVSKVFGESMGMDDKDAKARNNPLLLSGSTNKTGNLAIGTGQVAGVVGFTKSKSSFIFSIDSNNKVVVNLKQLKGLNVKKMAKGVDPPLDSYAEYGLALRFIGLDKTTTKLSGTSKFFDKVVYFCYWLANSTPFLMGIVVKVLQLLNPFVYLSSFMSEIAAQNTDNPSRAFAGFAKNDSKFEIHDENGHAIDTKNPSQSSANTNFWNNKLVGSILKPFSNYVKLFEDLSLKVLLPLILGFGIFSILLLRKSAKSTFGRIAVRFLIMFFGIPIVGSVYTQTLNSMADSNGFQSGYFTRIVYTNYLDFRSWAYNTRLGLPDELTESISKTGKLGNKGLSLGEVTLNLNAYALNDPTLVNLSDTGNSTVLDNPYDDLTDTTSKKNEPKADVGALLSIASQGLGVSSSDYEGIVKSEAQKLIDTSDSKKNKALMNIFTLDEDFILDDSDSIGLLSDVRSSSVENKLQEGSDKKYYYKFDIYNAGALKRLNGKYRVAEGHRYSVIDSKGRSKTIIPAFSTDDSAYNGSGLTPLGLYNYLNSTFEPGSKDDTQFSDGTIAIYSPNESSNDLVRPYHLAVVMTGNATEVVFKYVLLCVTFLALALLQFAVVVSIFKLAVSKFASMAGNIVGTALGSVTSFVKLASAALVTVGVIFASLLLYNLYAGILVGLFDWADSVIGSFTGSNNIVNYIVKLVIVYFFTHFALRSIMVVSKNLGAMVDEIVQKISMALQQNWARNAALGSMAGAGMGGAYAGAGAGAGAGGAGGSGANGRDGKEPGALAKAGSVLGVGKQAEGLENLWETGGRALDAENKRRQANGEAPLETEGFGGALNKLRKTAEYTKKGMDAKAEDKKKQRQAKQDKKTAIKQANKLAGESLREKSGLESALFGGAAYAAGYLGSSMKNKAKGAVDAASGTMLNHKSKKGVSDYAKMMRVDEDELAKQRDGLVGNARHAYDNNEKAQESGVSQAGYVDEQVTRNMPGFDKSTVGQDGLRAETYVDDKGNQAMRFVDENGRTSDEASQVAELYATEQTLDELRNMDTSGMEKGEAQAHKKKLQRFENKAERLRSGLANIKTSDGKAKYQSDALAGQGLAKLNNSMQQTFGQRAGTKAGGAQGGIVKKAPSGTNPASFGGKSGKAGSKANNAGNLNTDKSRNANGKVSSVLDNARSTSGMNPVSFSGESGKSISKANNASNLNTGKSSGAGGKANPVAHAGVPVPDIPVHGRVEEVQARQANPNMIRSDGLRRGGSADVVKSLSENGVSRTIENLYDDQGRSLSDLTAMSNLQAAYDVVNYANESMDNGIDWRQDKVLSRQVEKAQENIDLWQNQLQSTGYDLSQVTQTTLAATMGSLEQSLGRTSEYNDHKHGNNRKTEAFVRRMDDLGKKPPKEEVKDELKDNNNSNSNVKSNQKPIAPKSVPRFRNSSPGGRGHKPSGRGSRGRKR